MKKQRIDCKMVKKAAIQYCRENGLSVEELMEEHFSFGLEDCMFLAVPKGCIPSKALETGVYHKLIPTLLIDSNYTVTESEHAREYLAE